MMRSSSGGDEMSDDVNVENVRTAADNLRLTVRIITIALILIALAALIYFVIIPTAVKVKNSSDTEARLDYLITKLDENKQDPEVANIISGYAQNFGDTEAAQVEASQMPAIESTQITTIESEVIAQ